MSPFNFKFDTKNFFWYNLFMKIGNLKIDGFAGLAPMAGVADRAMREICVSMGASLTVGELASAKGISLGDLKSAEYLKCYDNLGICGPQLFGCEPEIMALAAKKALEFCPDFIDINMGCPAPKIAGGGGGSALMKNPDLAGEIVNAVVSAADVPVTVKMRSGFNAESVNAVEVAKICEQAGAAAVTVHGRTREQMYAPPVNYDVIKAVKNAVKIPVIANGDIESGKDAKFVYEYTGCDFVLVGRAARGNPFVFKEINAFFENKPYIPPTLEERLDMCLYHAGLMAKYKESRTAALECRKHTAWYVTGINGAATLRRLCGQINSLDDVKRICEKALELNKNM